MCILNNISHRVSGAPNQLKPITKVRDIFVQCLHSCRDSPTVWPLCAFFFILLQFYVPFYVKKKKNDNFMCLLEFECAKRLKAHSRAIPELERQVFFFIILRWGRWRLSVAKLGPPKSDHDKPSEAPELQLKWELFFMSCICDTRPRWVKFRNM